MMMRTLCHLYSKSAPNRNFQYTVFFKTLNVNRQSWCFCVLVAAKTHSLPYISTTSSQPKWSTSILYIIVPSLVSSLPRYLFSALTFLTRKLSHVSESLCCSRENILDSIAWYTRLLAEPCSPLANLSCPIILTPAPCTIASLDIFLAPLRHKFFQHHCVDQIFFL